MNDAMHTVTMVRPPEIWVDQRVRLTYDALEALSARLAVIPGRKNIVWITHGVPISLSPAVTGTDWIDFTPYLRRLSERLDRENVSIYPVQQIPPGMAMSGPDTQHSGIGDEDTLEQFARYTGGRANGGSDIKEAIHQAMNDVRTAYQIGYYPSPQSWDGKFHKLKVTCARKGIRIQVKEGYYAWPEEPFTEDRQKDALQAALAAPMDAGEIGIWVRATPSVKAANNLELAVRVDPADVLLRQEGGQFTGELRFALASLNADGTAHSSPMAAMHMKLSPEQHDQILKSGITFQEELNVPSGAQKIRLAILDADGGGVGTVVVQVGQK
jgi:hypothetical protein